MGKICKHCGMESEEDQVCTWCGKALADSAASQPGASLPVAPAQGAPPAAAGKGKLPTATGRAAPVAGPRGALPTVASPHEGAARAMFEAEAMRAQTPVGKYYALGGGIVVLLLVVVQLLAYFAAMRLPPAAGAWQQYRSLNKVIAFTGPATWHFATHGVSGVGEHAELIGGSLYSVTLNVSQIASLMSDVFGATARASASLQDGAEGPPPLEKSQEGRLHAFLATKAKSDDPNYQEEGSMQPTTFAGGAAAYSDYTTKRSVGLMSVPMKGRRLTAPLMDLAFEIRLECPAAHWDEFEPLAQKILDSAAQTHGL